MEDIIAAVKDQYPQLIIVAVAFLLMLWLLQKNLFEPLIGIIAQRKSDREGLENEAGASTEESAELIARRKESLLAARNEALKVKEEARSRAQEESRVLLEETSAKLTAVRERKAQELEQELDKARAAMSEDIPRMASEIAERILQRPLA